MKKFAVETIEAFYTKEQNGRKQQKTKYTTEHNASLD